MYCGPSWDAVDLYPGRDRLSQELPEGLLLKCLDVQCLHQSNNGRDLMCLVIEIVHELRRGGNRCESSSPRLINFNICYRKMPMLKQTSETPQQL